MLWRIQFLRCHTFTSNQLTLPIIKLIMFARQTLRAAQPLKTVSADLRRRHGRVFKHSRCQTCVLTGSPIAILSICYRAIQRRVEHSNIRRSCNGLGGGWLLLLQPEHQQGQECCEGRRGESETCCRKADRQG